MGEEGVLRLPQAGGRQARASQWQIHQKISPPSLPQYRYFPNASRFPIEPQRQEQLQPLHPRVITLSLLFHYQYLNLSYSCYYFLVFRHNDTFGDGFPVEYIEISLSIFTLQDLALFFYGMGIEEKTRYDLKLILI